MCSSDLSVGSVALAGGVGDALGDTGVIGGGVVLGAFGAVETAVPLLDPPDDPPFPDDPPLPDDPPPPIEVAEEDTVTTRDPVLGPAPVTVSVVAPTGSETVTWAVPFVSVAVTGETPPVTVTW